MKFFSLIEGAEVHPAPGVLIIPSSEFSHLASAQEIVARAEEEAEALKRHIKAEGEKLKEEAEQEGFQKGLEQFNHHLLKLDEELKRIEQEIHEQMLPLALRAARKIVGEELKLHPDRIVDIVASAIKPILQHRKVILYVNRADLESVEREKTRLKALFEHVDSFSVRERDDVEPGGCLIETEAGILNAQLEQQWRALETAFTAFKKK